MGTNSQDALREELSRILVEFNLTAEIHGQLRLEVA